MHKQHDFYWNGIMDLEAIDDELSFESIYLPRSEAEAMYESRMFIRNQINRIRGIIGSFQRS
jgi:hypothetical protein